MCVCECRKCLAGNLEKQGLPCTSGSVNYAQMQLQVDRQALDSDLCPELLFSPVLMWKPGRKKHGSQIPLSIKHLVKHQGGRATSLPSVNKLASPRPHPHPHAPVQTPPPLLGGGGKERMESEVGLRRLVTENVTGKRSQLPVRTTNLTDALLPQESFVKENKVKLILYVVLYISYDNC